MIKLLLLGDSGTGKTTLASEIMNWGKTLILDGDGKFRESLSQEKRELIKSSGSVIVPPGSMKEIVEAMQKHKDAVSILGDTYGGLTSSFLTEIVTNGGDNMDPLLSKDAKIDKAAYGVLGRRLDLLFGLFIASGKNIIILGHLKNLMEDAKIADSTRLPGEAINLNRSTNVGGGVQVFEGFRVDGEGSHGKNLQKHFTEVYYTSLDPKTKLPRAYGQLNPLYNTKTMFPEAFDKDGYLKEFSLKHLEDQVK